MSSTMSMRRDTPADVHFKTKGKVIFCLDESGSMQENMDYVIDAYNKFLNKLKGDPRVMYDFSLWTFNDYSKQVESDKPIDEIVPLGYNNYHPDGYTALFDTILDSVLSLGSVNPNTKVVVVVISDGGDNSSKAKSEDVLNLVETLSGLPNWTFIYLGAYDYYEEDARQMGFSPGNVTSIGSSNLDDILDRLATNIQGLCLNEVDKETMLLER